jgi:hypothetical protein
MRGWGIIIGRCNVRVEGRVLGDLVVFILDLCVKRLL